MLAFAGLTAIALVALLVGEARGAQTLRFVAKPLASTGFLGVAVAAGALDSRYGMVVLLALALCWLGDVLLLWRAEAPFRAGLVSFLLGHVAFVAAFALRGVDALWLVAAALLVAPVGWAALAWLRPHLPGSMRVPVLAYVVVISTMVAFAFGVFPAAGLVLLAGALCFYVSDLAVARDRFVAPGFGNRLWGLPLYYGGTLLLATTAGAA
jgi:uncharacterized membrane protein YhhN